MISHLFAIVLAHLLAPLSAFTGPMALTMNRQMMDPHAYTALPIAAARAVAHDRSGEWINDPLAKKLVAGENHLISAGSNVEYMTMRKLIGDELVLQQYAYGTRQIVSLGAGMDSRAFRLGLNDSTFFEVDKQGLFDVKEPLVSDSPLQCAARHTVVGTIGSMNLADSLGDAGFDSSRPTTWLMEGLLPYLTVPIMKALASDIGALSAPGSALWADGFSKTSVDGGMVFHGVPFESGFDDYDDIFRNVGFETSEAIDFAGISLDKYAGRVHIDKRYVLTPQQTHGRPTCLMVRAYKSTTTV